MLEKLVSSCGPMTRQKLHEAVLYVDETLEYNPSADLDEVITDAVDGVFVYRDDVLGFIAENSTASLEVCLMYANDKHWQERTAETVLERLVGMFVYDDQEPDERKLILDLLEDSTWAD